MTVSPYSLLMSLPGINITEQIIAKSTNKSITGWAYRDCGGLYYQESLMSESMCVYVCEGLCGWLKSDLLLQKLLLQTKSHHCCVAAFSLSLFVCDDLTVRAAAAVFCIPHMVKNDYPFAKKNVSLNNLSIRISPPTEGAIMSLPKGNVPALLNMSHLLRWSSKLLFLLQLKVGTILCYVETLGFIL